VATLSVHTSPLDQPGTGDAGGMNVYVLEVSRRLAEMGVAVDVFTRATSSALPPVVEVAPGVLVRHVVAGPYEGLDKADLPAQLCPFTSEVLRVEAGHEPGFYDLVHSHYWVSGQVGRGARSRWGVPLVHTMHTMGKVKNAALATGDTPEPMARLIGEEQVVRCAEPHFRKVESSSGRLDYIETIRQWRQRFAEPSLRKSLLKLTLVPRWATSREFRLAFTSGVSANSVCFERELLDHHRIVFEKREVAPPALP